MSSRSPVSVESAHADAEGSRRACAIESPDALTPQRLAQESPDELLVAVDRNGDAARVSLWRAGPFVAGARAGVLGHYAARHRDAGVTVIEAACAKLRERGATLVLAPMDGSTWRRYRFVTWRGRDPPFLLEPQNPAEWPAHFTAARFAPYAHYRSTRLDDLRSWSADTALDTCLTAEGFRVRPFDAPAMQSELSTLWRLSCDAFAHNLGYTPLAEAAFHDLYAPLVAAVPPELVSIAERDGEPVGFLFAYPDALQAAKGGAVDTVVVKTLAVVDAWKRHGIGRWLYERTVATARERGFRKVINALMHDDNPSRRLGGAQQRLLRRYTLYARCP